MPGVAATGSDGEVFEHLHARLARPFDVVATMSALVGMAPQSVARGVGLSLATAPEAGTLLAAMPTVVRSLATSLQSHHERCIGELRGPVLWSETMSARASSFGDRDLFVCATPARAYDIDENRVLVAALRILRDAGRAATDNATGPLEDPTLRAARKVGSDAGRWLDHPSLAPISLVKPTPRALRRTRSGKHRRTYQPALDVLDRAVEPLGAAQVARWRDARTCAQHRVLLGLLERLESDGRRRVPAFRAERGALLAGPLQYHHGRGGAGRGALSGVLLGPLLIDVPLPRADGTVPDRAEAEAALAARAGGRPSLAVLDDADLDRAVARAVELAGASRRS